MTPLPPSALIRCLLTGSRGRIDATCRRPGEAKPYRYLVLLEDGSRVERTRDQLEVCL
jgi:hypothetical protein